jgi:stage II sporulation protein D
MKLDRWNASLACGACAVLALTSCAPLPPPSSAPVPPTPGSGPPPRTTPETGTPPAADSRISVGLAWDLDTLTLLPVAAARATVERRGRSVGEPSAVAGPVHVARDDRRAEVRWRDGQLQLGAGDTLVLEGTAGSPESPARFIRWNGKSWRGQFRVFLNPRGSLTLVSRLPLEPYLLGVIPAEIGALAEDLIEAGRAQAIAARSYTLFYRGRRAEEGFDLYGTVEDQVYVSVEGERPLATRCVTTTAGIIATSQGVPIRANYSSTCGGISAEVWEGWPTPPLPYLTSHLDRRNGPDHCVASPHHRWREAWSAAEFTANLARFGPQYGVRMPSGGVGDLVDVNAASRSRSGRVWRLVVTTTRGSLTIPAYSLRQVLRRPGRPESILRSNLFKVDVRRDPRTRRAIEVIAAGGGSGHGVGLCQTGALGMARAGARGEEILRHYYPGTTLSRAP